jgi:hypothetical protein
MVTAKRSLAGKVARYAATFHDTIGYRHQVASPLGAWLLLALCAPAATGADAHTLTRLLGGGAAESAGQAAELLAVPHPLVAAAAAVWSQPGAVDGNWLGGLPATVEQGEIPGQKYLDQWADDHTFGLIKKFPLRVAATIELLIATALATKVSWAHPFDLAPGTALGESSAWAGQLARVLRSPAHPAHSAFIASTDSGDLAVHVARAAGGLLVTSVIAEPDVAPAEVMAQAHRIAIATATNQQVPRRSLFDLPAGTGPLWTLAEERSGGPSGERCVAVLPTWSADSQHDLEDPALGFAAAAAGLKASRAWAARQAAMASYTRTGFEAAAITTLVGMMAARPRTRRGRVAELRFGHPYAVVAVTEGQMTAGAFGPWHGIPAFSAWVAAPSEAE